MMSMLQNGDCLDEMRDLKEGCVDSIVTDPPYGLAFMGKDWDYGVPGEAFWKEALRVAKPGAHLLAFGGTRTYHRLACAIEDAGWEIRDCCFWCYGCLDEETQILTQNGWKGIGEINVGDAIIGYNTTERKFIVEPCERTYLYDYDDTAYRIQSDSTDQLVSRNHRVIVERGGVEVFEYAENLAQEHEARVPVLESLQNLLDHISMLDKRAGNSEQNVLAGMCRGVEAEDAKETLGRPFTKHDLSCVRKEILSPESMEAQSENKRLLTSMQRKITRKGIGEVLQNSPAQEKRTGNQCFADTNDRQDESCVERRSDISASQRELCDCSICTMPRKVSTDGTEGRVCDGASPCSGEGNREIAQSDGSRASYQPQSAGQQTREPDVVPDKSSPQNVRGTWRTATTLARIKPVHYKGRMWCVSVPSGAIVARRNGKIFVTGNSGFPKSMDVSKAIDKMLGAERRVVGVSTHGSGPNRVKLQNHGKGDTGIGIMDGSGKVFNITAPATPEAAAWNGWGTCLKPACEPIVIARKPLEGTVAANVLKYGTGAINIDGCRVATSDKLSTHGDSQCRDEKSAKVYGSYKPAKRGQTAGQQLGRFPANLIHDGSDEVLALFPNSNGSGHARTLRRSAKPDQEGWGMNKQAADTTELRDAGSGSAARFFYCAKASRKERGEGNLHPTVKPLALMRYLVRLVTRKGGIVLDPFMGSGTTGVAAIQEGMNFVGIERDPHYYEIASDRIRKAKPVEQKPKDMQMELPL